MRSMLVEKPSNKKDVFIFQTRGPKQLWPHFIGGVALVCAAYRAQEEFERGTFQYAAAIILGYIPGVLFLLVAFGWVLWFGTLVVDRSEQVVRWSGWKGFGFR